VTGTLQAAMQTTAESSSQEFLKLAAMLPTYIYLMLKLKIKVSLDI